MALLIFFTAATGTGVVAADFGLGPCHRLGRSGRWGRFARLGDSGTRIGVFKRHFLFRSSLATLLFHSGSLVRSLNLHITQESHDLIFEALQQTFK